jgi:hypothetical protein
MRSPIRTLNEFYRTQFYDSASLLNSFNFCSEYFSFQYPSNYCFVDIYTNSIYNTPVHAITDGEVLACWRNAPSNPRPGESHPGRLSQVKTISRSGNFLVVKMANENRTVLYAHLKTGTVPASLCPFNNELMQNADKKGGGDYPLESVIPAAQRPKVKQGQIIGRVGNVGASSGPHLHIDRSDILGTNDEGVSLPINFHGAWVKNITNLQNDATKNWEVLDGKELVTPKTAILPFYSSGRPELNKAAVSADDFQFVFSQAIKSGYRPVWIDGYNVNGKTYYMEYSKGWFLVER